MSEDEKPGKVIVAIMTDGYENASREFSQNQIKDLIARQEKEWNWDFAYLSSSPTAKRDAVVMGFAANAVACVAPTAKGTKAAYRGFSDYVAARSSGGDMNISDAYKNAESSSDE
jgi:hypothetical protein